MKKSLVALATMSVVASAFADVDVSGGIKMYGVIDQAVTNQALTSANTGVDANYNGLFAANATSRIGFKGQRDLSEGFKGIFQVEIQIDPDTSTLLPSKNRTAFVGLQSSESGTLMMGTMETAAYETFGMDVNGRIEYKPQVWRTTTSLDLQDRANNSIKYISPKFGGGFNVHLQKSFNEQATTTGAYGTTANTFAEFGSLAVKYDSEELKAAYVHDATSNALMGYKFAGLSNAGVSTTGTTDYALYYGMASTASVTNTNLAIVEDIQRDILSVSYKFTNFTLNYLYAKSYQNGTYGGSNTTNTFGIKVPYEKFTIALSYGTGVVDSYASSATSSLSGTYTTATAPTGRAKDGNISDTTLGVYYNFDKSTSVYFLGSRSTSSVGLYDGSNTTVAIGGRYNF
ncbi:MAG: porin [Gammaproteobacteria bacterium]|nr:porin [Gammaproteobacteria bacterium]